jgi:hypothetical protein
MFESSENMRMGGDYNPAPVVETLGMLAGGGASAARALGTEGSLAALGLRPMRDPVPGVIDIETLRSGGNDKLFDIVNELGKRVGWTAITPRPVQKNLYVNEIQGAKGPLSFGTADTRSLIDALKQEFPWAESVSGYRTSGARAKANNRSQARMQIRPDTTSPAQKELREMIGDY